MCIRRLWKKYGRSLIRRKEQAERQSTLRRSIDNKEPQIIWLIDHKRRKIEIHQRSKNDIGGKGQGRSQVFQECVKKDRAPRLCLQTIKNHCVRPKKQYIKINDAEYQWNSAEKILSTSNNRAERRKMQNEVPQAIEFFDDEPKFLTQDQAKKPQQIVLGRKVDDGGEYDPRRMISREMMHANVETLWGANLSVPSRQRLPIAQPQPRVQADLSAEKALIIHEKKCVINERHALNRYMRDVGIWEGRDGELRLEVEVPDSVRKNKVICKAKNIRVTDYFSAMCKMKVRCIEWDNEGDHEELWVIEGDTSPEQLIKKLRKKGLILHVSPQFRSEADEGLMEYLAQKAIEVEIPMRHGWNQRGTGEYYIAVANDFTMREAREKCAKCK